jgi:hypothetical protein
MFELEAVERKMKQQFDLKLSFEGQMINPI